MISHKNLKKIALVHSKPICGCDLLLFALEMKPAVLISKISRKIDIEFYFETSGQHKEVILLLFKLLMRKTPIHDYGNSARIDLTRRSRIFIKFIYCYREENQ